MINWLKISFIIFLCLLINEKYAFSDHNKKIFEDSSEDPITKKTINFKPNEPKSFRKVKSDIAKKHCTKKNFVIPSKMSEMGEAKFNDDGSITVEIQYYHEKKSPLKIINLKKLNDQLKKLNHDGIEGFKVESFLKSFYCIKNKGERQLIYSKNSITSKTLIDEELIEKGLEIPEGILIQPPYFTTASSVMGPIEDESGEKNVETKPPTDPFKEDLRNALFIAAKEKLDAFDNKILEIERKLNLADGELITLRKNYKDIKKSVNNTLDVTFNKNIPEIREKYLLLKEQNESKLNDKKIKEIDKKLKDQKDKISGNSAKGIKGLKERKPYTDIEYLKSLFEKAKKNKDLKKNKKYYTVDIIDEWKSISTEDIEEDIDRAKNAIDGFKNKIQDINVLREEIEDLDTGANKKSTSDLILEYIIYIVIFLFVVAVITFIYLQSRKIKKLSKMSRSTESKFTDMEDKLRSTSAKIRASRETRRGERPEQSSEPTEAPKTPQQIKLEKFNDLKRDYDEAKENFSKIAGFKQKWNGVALSRKERQEGSKTVLVSSGRAFEKSEIWCVGFDDKIFAFPGSSVYSNMAIYMNLDFAKAQMDFKGVFNISEGSNYSVEPSGLRKGGAGYVVEMQGKIQFPR